MPHVWDAPGAWQSLHHWNLLPKSCAWCPTVAAAAADILDRILPAPAWSECAASWQQLVVAAVAVAAAAPAVAAVDSCTRFGPWPRCASSATVLART